MPDILSLARPHLQALKPYSSARDDFRGDADAWLDANEYPEETGFNRYPDSRHDTLREQLSVLYGISDKELFVGNGSDEAIDLVIRAFCEPAEDRIMILTPTYGMYGVCASINNVPVIRCPLSAEFDIDTPRTLDMIRSYSPKLIFACSPNNPTGNLLKRAALTDIANMHSGLLIVDQAYIEFSDSDQGDAAQWLEKFNNIILLRTLSKAAGLAGLRVGCAIANPEIITLLNKIKPPYNVSTANASSAQQRLTNGLDLEQRKCDNSARREVLIRGLETCPLVVQILPSETNFVLVRFQNPKFVYRTLVDRGIVVRDRTTLIDNALRITVGTQPEIDKLLTIIRSI